MCKLFFFMSYVSLTNIILPLTCQDLTRALLENYAKIDKLTKALKGRGFIHPGSEVPTPPAMQPETKPATVLATMPVPKQAPTRKAAAPPPPQDAPGDQNAAPGKEAGWKRIQGDRIQLHGLIYDTINHQVYHRSIYKTIGLYNIYI